jgi:hypothetical protein
MWSIKPLSSSGIAKEAKKLLLCKDLNEEIRFDVENILAKYADKTLTQNVHNKIEHELCHYFKDLESKNSILDFTVMKGYDDKYTVYYRQSLKISVVELSIQIA